MIQNDTRKPSSSTEQDQIPFDDVLDLVGTGRYSLGLLLVCSLIQLGSTIDMLGFSLIMPTCACDLNMSIQQQGILSSMPFIGVILVSYWWGYLADTRGRRQVLIWSMYASFVLSTLSSLSPHWIVLAAIKFLSVCFSCAANAGTYTLLGECCPAKIRSRNMLLISTAIVFIHIYTTSFAFFVLGSSFAPVVPLIGITFRPWRLLIILMALPCGVSAVLLHFFYESPKFLAHCGRIDEAMEALCKMYSINKRVRPDQFPIRHIALEDSSLKRDENQSLLRSMWNQTVPLFRPPYLLTTIRLFFLISIVYVTNNSFAIWVPQIFNAFFEYLEKEGSTTPTLCDLISMGSSSKSDASEAVCQDRLADSTLNTILLQSVGLTLLSVAVAKLASWKKSVLIACLLGSTVCAVTINLMPEPISSIVVFLIFRLPCVCNGVVPAYFVELYPTGHRGMVACLGMMMGRLSSFIGINIVGNVIFSHCHATFYCWAVLLFSGVLVAGFYLPPDKTKPDQEKTSL